ncbi:MAG: hypothetical protein NTX17_00810 [Candidatus Eisenbacteria bacterium]|nr:hypothetical protein [Candidatus Eisenbacteria bacterium]
MRLFFLALFSVGMAFVESAVVVYLRALFYPEGFSVSLTSFPRFYYATEIWREAATIVMLCSVALLSARKGWWDRLAYFLWCFGIWDIFYYVWLYALIAWPPSLLSADVLFLIPVPWVAPVIVPVVISWAMIVAAIAILRGKTRTLRDGIRREA